MTTGWNNWGPPTRNKKKIVPISSHCSHRNNDDDDDLVKIQSFRDSTNKTKDEEYALEGVEINTGESKKQSLAILSFLICVVDCIVKCLGTIFNKLTGRCGRRAGATTGSCSSTQDKITKMIDDYAIPATVHNNTTEDTSKEKSDQDESGYSSYIRSSKIEEDEERGKNEKQEQGPRLADTSGIIRTDHHDDDHKDQESKDRNDNEDEDETRAILLASKDNENKDDDTVVLTSKLMFDQYGQRALYTGAASKSFGMPNGKGRLEYIEKRSVCSDKGGDRIDNQRIACGRALNGHEDFHEQDFVNDDRNPGTEVFIDNPVLEGDYVHEQIILGGTTYQGHRAAKCHYWLDRVRDDSDSGLHAQRSIYKGEFRHGRCHGHGKMTWDDGGWYVGEWRDGTMHGYGKDLRPDGSLRHDGEWYRGQPIRSKTSTSTVSLAFESIANDSEEKLLPVVTKKQIFTGEKNKSTRMPHATEHLEYKPKGRSGEGDPTCGKRTLPVNGGVSKCDGYLCEGGLQNTAKDGFGIMSHAAGHSFEGGHIHGEMIQGKMTCTVQSIYDGTWVDGSTLGQDDSVHKEISEYEGEFQYGSFHGNGRMIWKDGGKYVGEWRDGQMHGRGIRVGKCRQRAGEFSRGQFIGASTSIGSIFQQFSLSQSQLETQIEVHRNVDDDTDEDSIKTALLVIEQQMTDQREKGKPSQKQQTVSKIENSSEVDTSDKDEQSSSGEEEEEEDKDQEEDGEWSHIHLHAGQRTTRDNIINTVSAVPLESDPSEGESEDEADILTDILLVTEEQIIDPYGEKGVYTGALSKSTGMPNGKGRLEYEKEGRWYEGDWIHGRWTGYGRLSNGDGDFYEGGLKNDHKHGTGVMRFTDGRVFEGEYIRGQMKQGKMTYQDGSVYVGSWVDGMRHGRGKCIFVDGSEYEGEFRQGNFHGHGQMTWNDGGWYVGEWSDGEMHGRGKEIRQDGSLRHDGEWTRGQPVRSSNDSLEQHQEPNEHHQEQPPHSISQKMGWKMSDVNVSADTLFVTDKETIDPYGDKGFYTGALSKSTGMPNGKGRIDYEKEGRWYEGDWIHGRWTGYGRLSNGDGDFYEGGLKNDQKHGTGVMRFADGRVFEGEYIHGQVIQGKMTYQDGSVYCDSWGNGMQRSCIS